MSDPDKCPERIDMWKNTMPTKLTDAELAQAQRWVVFNIRDEWADIETRSVQELLDHIAALTKERDEYAAQILDRAHLSEVAFKELKTIKGRLDEDALIAVYNEAYVDNMGHDTQIVQAIIAHVLGEKS